MNNRLQKIILFKPKWQGEMFLFWYGFFMAFPLIVPFFNISFYIFPLLLLVFKKRYGYIFLAKNFLFIIVNLFILGVIINLFSTLLLSDFTSFKRTLRVVPNYIYWVLMVLFFYSHRNNINIPLIARGVFYGLISSTIFFFFIRPLRLHRLIPFVNNLSQNSFAFLLICFSAISIYYIKKRYNLFWGFILFLVLAYVGFRSGSRSSSVLVFVSGSITLFLNKISLKKIALTISIVFLAIIFIFQTTFVKKLIYNLNPRAYTLIYELENTFDNDYSFLARMVQVEKGIRIFQKKPITGIGLNNFSDFDDVELDGMFEGTDNLVKKINIANLSAHNSYVSILAEGGLVLAIPFFLILLFPLLKALFSLSKLSPFNITIFISFIVMLVHLWFISAILNVYAWFLIAIVTASVHQNPKITNKE